MKTPYERKLNKLLDDYKLRIMGANIQLKMILLDFVTDYKKLEDEVSQ